MAKILAYRCNILPTVEINPPGGISIEALNDLNQRLIYEHEVLIWSNNFTFGTPQLKLFPNLKVFINWGTNDTNIQTLQQFIKRGITVKKVDYYCTETLSEYILALILNFERKLNLLLINQKIIGNEVYGKKVGIIGLGKIGFRVAQILKKSLNCHVFYYSRNNKILDSFEYASIEKIFRICDYAILTIKSKNFTIDKNKLLLANKNLVIVNICNDAIMPLKNIIPLIKQNKIRGFIGDLSGMKLERKDFPEDVVLVNHYGYLSHEAIIIKHNILYSYLKKILYESKKNSIYVIRHGQTEWNKDGLLQGSLDSPLTKEGIVNVQKIAQFLKNRQVKIIFTSPLGRAKQTAKIIAQEIRSKVVVIPDFREMSFGIFEGKKQEAIKNLFRDFFTKRENSKCYKLYESYPEGESYFNVFLRTIKTLTEILVRYQNFAIVGHESVNRIIRGIIRELPLEEMVSLRQKNNEVVSINPYSLEETITRLNF